MRYPSGDGLKVPREFELNRVGRRSEALPSEPHRLCNPHDRAYIFSGRHDPIEMIRLLLAEVSVAQDR